MQAILQTMNTNSNSDFAIFVFNSVYSNNINTVDALYMLNLFNSNDWITRLKAALATGITSTAELVHEIYTEISLIVSDNPSIIGVLNIGVDGLRYIATQFTDTNHQTATWLDLFFMWLFEIGENPINFVNNDVTTISLMTQEGVTIVRDMALNKIQNNDFSETPYTWNYGQGEFYDGMQNGNIATSFLGTYTTTVNVTSNNNGTYTLFFTVTNPSSWESATRLRIDNDNNGAHDGIFPNKSRGDGIHLGGNFNQIWSWTEIH